MAAWPDTREVKSWKEFVSKVDEVPAGEWMFRGQRLGKAGASHWTTLGLKTSLERVAEADLSNAPRIESFLLREFQRRAHHYLASVPRDDDTLEWFALMEHYGAPTRLLDWTYSPFVAAFFALEKGDPGEIWAINRRACLNWINRTVNPRADPANALNDYFKQDGTQESRGRFNTMVFSSAMSLVVPVAPLLMNERLTIQQGVFLCPCDVTKSFRENLVPIGSLDDERIITRFAMTDEAEIKNLLRALYRMNMSRASLFPGLQGFSESLRARVTMDDGYVTQFDWTEYHKRRLNQSGP